MKKKTDYEITELIKDILVSASLIGLIPIIFANYINSTLLVDLGLLIISISVILLFLICIYEIVKKYGMRYRK